MEKNNYSDNNENYKNDNNYKIIIKKGEKKIVMNEKENEIW